jgi:hypothetical protein
MPNQVASATLSAVSSVTAGITAQWASHMTAAAVGICSAAIIAHWAASDSILGQSEFGIATPTSVHHFAQTAITPASIPFVRAVPQPFQRPTFTIQPPKPPVQPGPTVQVRIKR